MTPNYDRAPFPYFGGKRDAAESVWAALGNVEHYVEPFFGSGANLLLRPHLPLKAAQSETVNDMDGLLVNMWRAMQRDPDAVAEAASWPVSEADLHARHLAPVRWRAERNLELLMGDPDWYDAKMAGWWIYGVCSWIGSGWCRGDGPWVLGEGGRLTRREGEGVGITKKLPHMGDRGIFLPPMREPGVARQLPSMARRGVTSPTYQSEAEGLTMPLVQEWFRHLSRRLRHVRIVNGSWERVVTTGVLKSLAVRQGGGKAGVFLDPPYGGDVRMGDLYVEDDGGIAAKVREWCKGAGADPDLRIVLAGYDTEHTELESLGWTVVEWFKTGFLKGGYGVQGSKGTQQRRERLWLSPHCLSVDAETEDFFSSLSG